MLGYLYLALAVGFELLGSAMLKASKGFTEWLPSVIMVGAYIATFFFLTQTLKFLPLGLAYAIWGGVGIAATALIGVVFFKESLNIWAILGIILIIGGVILLNFFSEAHAA
jgi:small multidrug resistance pump